MIRLLLLLLGSEIVQRQWRWLAALGAFWALIGLAILIDALDGSTVIRPHYFGYLLLLEGLVALAAGFLAPARRSYRLMQAAFLIVPAFVIMMQPPQGNFIIAMLLGTVLLVDGCFRIASAHVIRFRGWRLAIVGGLVEILFALGTLQPWPTWYEGTIGCNIGALLIVSGLGAVMLARRLRLLPADTPISTLFATRSTPYAAFAREEGQPVPGELVVHVWTPAGSLGVQARRPLVDRYVAAVDQNGTVSTGHAALELPPDLYISHYPAVEIDRSPESFGRVLNAGGENDVPGRFLPGYREEAEGWCEATEHVRFTRFDAQRLRAFWQHYRENQTYNLTNRNCSSAVAHALDVALEGALGRSAAPWRASLAALVTPELWAAGVLRRRAEAMAWTPGLVLDYARLLQIVVEPAAAGALSLRLRRAPTN